MASDALLYEKTKTPAENINPSANWAWDLSHLDLMLSKYVLLGRSKIFACLALLVLTKFKKQKTI